jgi:hypothetical protein
LIAEHADALVGDDPLVPAEDRDQVAQEVEEEIHGPFRPVRRTGATARGRLVAIREKGAVTVEQHADSVVLKAVERTERVDDEVDMQPVGRDSETAHEPGDPVGEHGRPGKGTQYVGPVLLEPLQAVVRDDAVDVDVAEPVRLAGAVAADQVDGEDAFVVGEDGAGTLDDLLLPLVSDRHLRQGTDSGSPACATSSPACATSSAVGATSSAGTTLAVRWLLVVAHPAWSRPDHRAGAVGRAWGRNVGERR